MINSPLSGVRVIELSHMIMGPSCGMILGDLGADVIKVEPITGDNTRRLLGSGAGFFPCYNRNKRSIAVDLTTAEGLAVAGTLIDGADVLIENFRCGALDELGLGFAQVVGRNPKLIYCSFKGFLAGPYQHRAALDEVVQMMGGLAYMTGPPGRPLRAGASVNDIMGGMFGVIAILAALHERTRTGKGQHVKSALFENNAFLVAQHMMQFVVTGRPPSPMPDRLAVWGVYDIFNTREAEQLFIAVVTDRQWLSFCQAFELPELAGDQTLATNQQRVGARDRLVPTLQDVFLRLAKSEITETCDRAGIPFAPIARPEDLFADPQLQQPGAMLDVTLSDGRVARTPALPLEFDGTRLGLRHDVPSVGAHSRQIATELGLERDEIERYFATGVLACAPEAMAN